jgi:Bacterial Ig-like domain
LDSKDGQVDLKLTSPFNNKKIRLHIIWCLVFSFCVVLSCSDKKKEDGRVTIQWEGRRAVSVIIPRTMLPGIPKDSIEQLLHIQLLNTNTPMSGEYTITDDAVIFRPLIAFTHGLKYEVRLINKIISEIEIPANNVQDAPAVTSIYPTHDSLPMNLLKIYIEFSKPMQEGQSAKNIIVIKNGHDTIPSIFLDLEPELWNKESTILTLWLDPGRVKRDLQPNKAMGSPLQYGATYRVLIKSDWPDAEGVSLENEYRKDFMVGLRDTVSPDPKLWTIHSPEAGTMDPLKINLHESLDYVLLKNAVRIVDHKGNMVNAVTGTEAEETILTITPSAAWSSGDYTIEIESRLEDLAGNNLNRLFDKDLTRQSTGGQEEVYKRSFHIY